MAHPIYIEIFLVVAALAVASVAAVLVAALLYAINVLREWLIITRRVRYTTSTIFKLLNIIRSRKRKYD